jgi:hypothetical protein
MYSQKEVLEKTGIKCYQLEYLIRTKKIPVIRKGKGIPREFPEEAIKIIKERVNRLGQGKSPK